MTVINNAFKNNNKKYKQKHDMLVLITLALNTHIHIVTK